MQISSRRVWLPLLLLVLHLALLWQLQGPGNWRMERGPTQEMILWQLPQPRPPSTSPATPLPPVLPKVSRAAPLPPTAPRPRAVPRPEKPARTTAPDAVSDAVSTPAGPVLAQPAESAKSAESTPAAPEPTAAPLLDRAALSAAIRNNERNRSKDPLEAVHQREHINRSVEAAVAKGAKEGARKDCQTAYAGAGLLAVLPLAFGTLTDKGCKWK